MFYSDHLSFHSQNYYNFSFFCRSNFYVSFKPGLTGSFIEPCSLFLCIGSLLIVFSLPHLKRGGNINELGSGLLVINYYYLAFEIVILESFSRIRIYLSNSWKQIQVLFCNECCNRGSLI